jgi:BMFP domain-containing protein YqiC
MDSALAFCGRLRYQPPMAEDGIDKLAKTLAEELPQSLRSMRDDLEKNFRSVLRSGLSKLDLVTREEFEVQEAVLQRTREKLEALDAHLQKMESELGAKSTGKKKTAKKKTAKKKSAKKKSKR